MESVYYVLAIDIETSGSSLIQNGLVSIGCSLQDQHSNELRAFQVNLTLPENHIYEERCLQEFWLKNPRAHEFVQKDALSPDTAIKMFSEFLENAEKDYPDLIIVSDNPSFDIAWLNFYLSQYTDKLPLNYSQKGDYRPIWDLISMRKSLISVKSGDFISNCGLTEKPALKSRWKYDHTSLNDARVIADFFNQTVQALRLFSVNTHNVDQ